MRFIEYKPGVASRLREALELHYLHFPLTIVLNYGNSNLGNIGHPTLLLNNPAEVSLCIDKPRALAKLRDARRGGLFEVPAVPEAWLVVKRRNHRGGKDCILIDGEEFYAEEYVGCSHEWRVHVVGDRTCARLKSGGTGTIRNRRRGWVFIQSDNVPQAIRDAAKQAIYLLSLDFGAVDIGWRENSPPVVYEVNTAPRLQVDTVLDWYANNFIRLIDGRI